MRIIRARLLQFILATTCLIILAVLIFLPRPTLLDSLRFKRAFNVDPFLVDEFGFAITRRQLPDLKQVPWPRKQFAQKPSGLRYANGSIHALPKAFDPVMSHGQHALFNELLKQFTKHMLENGYMNRFILYGGTLLGSYRHHEFIPWDDDMDLMVDETIRPRIQYILQQTGPDYLLHAQTNRDKFYRRLATAAEYQNDVALSRNSTGYPWGWPYLDIGYYRKNKTHTCEIAESYGRKYCWPNNLIFPLLYRPFGPYWLPAPFDTTLFLETTYPDMQKCVIYGYSHVIEAAGPRGEEPCSNLSNRYAFVKHRTSDYSIQSSEYVDLIDNLVVMDEVLFFPDDVSEQKLVHVLHVPTGVT